MNRCFTVFKAANLWWAHRRSGYVFCRVQFCFFLSSNQTPHNSKAQWNHNVELHPDLCLGPFCIFIILYISTSPFWYKRCFVSSVTGFLDSKQYIPYTLMTLSAEKWLILALICPQWTKTLLVNKLLSRLVENTSSLFAAASQLAFFFFRSLTLTNMNMFFYKNPLFIEQKEPKFLNVKRCLNTCSRRRTLNKTWRYFWFKSETIWWENKEFDQRFDAPGLTLRSWCFGGFVLCTDTQHVWQNTRNFYQTCKNVRNPVLE